MIDKTILSMSLWDILQEEGKEFLEDSNYEEAFSRFDTAVQTAQKQYGGEGPRTATSMRYLAVVMSKQDKLDDALINIEKSLAILENTFDKESLALLKTLTTYVEILELRGEKDKAGDLYNRVEALKAKEVQQKTTTELFAEEIPDNAAELPMTQDQKDRIEELLKRDEIDIGLVAEVKKGLEGEATYLWAHDIQNLMRKEIVKSFLPKEEDEKE